MKLSKEILEELYQFENLSVAKTALKLQVSPNAVNYWLKKYGIPLRSKTDAAYAQHKKIFKIKSDRSIEEENLFALGLGLYWGEGNKASKHSVRLGNTDPKLICVFVKFLKEICGIDDKEIKYGLQVFNDADPRQALAFWCNKLGCSTSQFYQTISVISPQGTGKYRKKNMHGVAQVYVNNTRFKSWILNEIDKMPR